MGKKIPHQLVTALALAIMLACITAGLLWGATAKKPVNPPAKSVKSSPQAKPASTPSETPSGIEIVAPESDAKLRGVALVQAQWANRSGYVIFRIDDRFAYATAPPYEMRWDTSTAVDGDHVVTVDAYDASSKYTGGSSIRVRIENTITAPPQGILLSVRYGEHDLWERRIVARGELSELRSGEYLPEGFDVLGGELQADISQAVMDAYYEGVSALVRNRLRSAALAVAGQSRTMPEVGQYAMVQISRNGLVLPATTAVSKPRLGLGEMSLVLPDHPIPTGYRWEAPLGVVADLYTRRAIFVQAQHTLEILRWFRGRECAVITSTYTIPEIPLYRIAPAQTAEPRQTASALSEYQVRLTGMMGQGMMSGGRRGAMGGSAMRGGMMGGGRRQGVSPGQAGGARRGASTTPTPRAAVGTGGLESARLYNLAGTRRTYITRQTGRILHIEDTLLGKLEFRTSSAQRASAEGAIRFQTKLTGMMGQGMMGGAGMRSGQRGGMRGAMGQRAGATGRAPGQAGTRRPSATTRQAPSAVQASIPAVLDYGFRLSSDLVVQ